MEAFVTAIENGNSLQNACRLIGVSDSAFYNWMNWADEPDAVPALVEFKNKIEQAKVKIEEEMVSIVRKAAFSGEWRAAAFWLERRRAADWGSKQSLEVGQAQPKPDPRVDATIARAKDAASIQREIVLMLNREPDKSKWPPDLFAAYQAMVNPKSLTIEGT
ncbi:MAG: hypothetical protein PHI71_15350 [Acidiphilium sp.]|nr:hypothetical protein [Acidiphilium sp.]